MRRDTRKSLTARALIPAGQPLTPENTLVRRPGHGIDPRLVHLALGRRAKADITHLPPGQLAAGILAKEKRIAGIVERIQGLLSK